MNCSYGRCTMVNLCHTHCVRKSLERDGWVVGVDGQLYEMYKRYRRTQIAEMAKWVPGFDMTGVSISEPDKANGSPREGDMIARNPKNHADKWLVAAQYFADNFEPLSA